MIASLVYRKPSEPFKFAVAIKGPACATIDEALMKLLLVTGNILSGLGSDDGPALPPNVILVEGADVNGSLMKARTSMNFFDTR